MLNQKILLKDYRKGPSKFNEGDVVTIQFELDGALKVLFTGSMVIADQLAKKYLYENESLRTAVEHAAEKGGITCPNWLEAQYALSPCM